MGKVQKIVYTFVGIVAVATVFLAVTENSDIPATSLFQKKHAQEQEKNHEFYESYVDGCKPSILGQYEVQCKAIGGALCHGNRYGFSECCGGADGIDYDDFCKEYGYFTKHKQCSEDYKYVKHKYLPCPTDPCKEPCLQNDCRGTKHSDRLCYSYDEDNNAFICDSPHWSKSKGEVCEQSCRGDHHQQKQCQYYNWNEEEQTKCI